MTSSTELDQERIQLLEERARFVRTETVRLIDIAKTGHYASTFSCAEIFAVLYYDILRLRRGEPDWPQRDRFLLGKGHAAVGLYPLLADWGFVDHEVLNGYTRLGNPLGDHPDMVNVPGIDFSSGSLGHNLSVGLGMALGARYASEPFDVYVLLGDGEQEEGQVWEAAMAAAHHDVRNLIAIVDRNKYSLDGPTDEINQVEPLPDKWRAFGWNVHEVDGHDIVALTTLLRSIRDGERTAPTVVIAHTVKGKGVSFMEEEFGWHLGWLDTEDERDVHRELEARK
ncbi:transketolase [Saccharopolyspora subtropica]|uniref:Transketolase n=1 Tax=Saccharopolyspora thermophila TaxID=89367 RepID=A0A917NH73_9PSEU|nr:transketolase [Saccharopolyspora subtropica]GGI97767.1 transketolase [Saccharopolyspora subtropica]